jgi:sugar/nucleoside kinase (ribokinase family)
MGGVMVNEPILFSKPVVIGTVALDIYSKVTETGIVTAYARYGGVCNNFACGLAAQGVTPTFISPRYDGEIGEMVDEHFKRKNILWSPLTVNSHLPVFSAEMNQNWVLTNEKFIDNEVFEVFTENRFSEKWSDIASASDIIMCLDLPERTINYICKLANRSEIRVWLIATNKYDIAKLSNISERIFMLSMNIDEVNSFVGLSNLSLDQVFYQIDTNFGLYENVIVTMGPKGVILDSKLEGKFVCEPSKTIDDKPTITAGDIMTSCLYAHYLKSKSMRESLNVAMDKINIYLNNMNDSFESDNYKLLI